MFRRLRTLALTSLVLLCACRSQPMAAAPSTYGVLAPFDAAQWSWVSTECVDGPIDLAKAGFERRLSTSVRGNTLRFTYDTTLASASCESTEVWSLTTAAGGEWRFSPQAVVTLPTGAACGAAARPERGVLRVSGDMLHEVRFGSAYCRGFDARFVYRRVPNVAPESDALVRHYVAHWNRRDADALAELFASDGTFIEALSKNDRGTPTRHEGRPAVRAWFERAFASTPWLGVELVDLSLAPESEALIASFRYMDPRLAAPLWGRHLFVIAGQEIFVAELQLQSDPIPR